MMSRDIVKKLAAYPDPDIQNWLDLIGHRGSRQLYLALADRPPHMLAHAIKSLDEMRPANAMGIIRTSYYNRLRAMPQEWEDE
jgi:hypothetical protein